MNDMFNFQKKWAEGLISPVFKSGETINPDNYRRITVQKTISKIMDTLITNRLIHFTDSLNIDDE